MTKFEISNDETGDRMIEASNAEIDETELYSQRMIDFRDWCEIEGFGFKVAVARAIAAFQIKHGSRKDDMGFEIIACAGRRNAGLDPGTCSIQKNGSANFAYSDLLARGIVGTAQVAVLVDKLTGRIAFRKARDGEPSSLPTVSKTKRIANIRISVAMTLLGKDCGKFNRRYPVQVKDDMLIIQL